jgi:GMP synthase (glutamine-hydrolysing)
MKPILVLRNEPEAPAGFLGDALDRRGVDWRTVRLDAGDLLPAPGEVGGVAVLGGAMGVHDEQQFPFLVREKRFVADCVHAGIPVLGLCLGCQMLAEVLGGRAYRAGSAEVVFEAIEPTEDGLSEPVVAAMAGRRVIRFHQDTFDLPKGATVLATGGGFLQAFRMGAAIGIQPHPEVTPTLLSGWLAGGGGRRFAIESGADPDEIIAAFTAARAEVEATAAAVFEPWIDEVSVSTSPPTLRTRGS